MQLTVRYFASIREAIGAASEVVDTSATDLGSLRAELLARGAAYADVLARHKAVRMVLTGKKYVSPALAQQLATAFTSDVHGAPHEKLSTREFEVFCKLAAGHSVSDIADELFLSVKTVSTHRARRLEKMNLRTNADLSYYAIKNDLIQ